MADIIFSNNASSLLQTTISAVDTTIELAAGFGSRFPQPVGDGSDYFYATLEDSSGNFEVVRCTARSTDLLTVVRGQDNTTPLTFSSGTTRVELRLVTVVVEEFLQVNGDTMTGPLDMAGNNLVDAVLTGASTSIQAGEIVGVPIRGDTGDTSNELFVPSGGGAPTIGANDILTDATDLIPLLDVAGVITLSSATVGVVIPGGAYFRVEGSTAADYIQLSNDDTDGIITGNDLTDLRVTGYTGALQLEGINLDLNDGNVLQSNLLDFSLEPQSITANSTTTTVDYTLGSYVNLTLATATTQLAFSNLPASGKLATVRLRIIQDGTGGRALTFPAGTVWPNGNAPTLSAGINEFDFVDLWTDDAGTTWYGSFATNFS